MQPHPLQLPHYMLTFQGHEASQIYLFNSAVLVVALWLSRVLDLSCSKRWSTGCVASSRTRPLTPLVGKFSKLKVGPKKNSRGGGGGGGGGGGRNGSGIFQRREQNSRNENEEGEEWKRDGMDGQDIIEWKNGNGERARGNAQELVNNKTLAPPEYLTKLTAPTLTRVCKHLPSHSLGNGVPFWNHSTTAAPSLSTDSLSPSAPDGAMFSQWKPGAFLKRPSCMWASCLHACDTKMDDVMLVIIMCSNFGAIEWATCRV